MGDSEINTNASSFDIQKELSSLVAKNIIPKKLADKLEKKLIDRNIRINKQQLHLLVTKINNVLRNYNNIKSESPLNLDENMQKLIDTIEKLEERITNIELGDKSEIEIGKASCRERV